MILKKPFGFIIKHFKIINIILLVPVLYVLFSFNDISSFYTRYVNNNYMTNETGLAGHYITVWLLIVLVLLIIANIFMFALMKEKSKPRKLYVFSIIYYFILFMLALLVYNNLVSIETGVSSQSVSKLFKDISFFATLPNYLIVALTLFKGIGFNIKTLKFDQDLELQITDEDEEEIEIGGNRDSGGYKKSLVHIIREFKYYVIENKFIMTCLLVLLLLLLSSKIYLHFGVYNKKYQLNQNMALDNIILSIRESYITNGDQGGNPIEEDKYYLAVKVKMENKSTENTSFSSSNFRIRVNGKNLYPNYDRSSRFTDIGRPYLGTNIPKKYINAFDKPTYSCEDGYTLQNSKCKKEGEQTIDPVENHNYSCPDEYNLINENQCELKEENSEYVIVYELDKNQIRGNYEMKILSDLQSDLGELNPSYKIIKFKPKKLLKEEDLGTAKLKEEIKLKDSFLGDTTIKIKKAEVKNFYHYNYEVCETKNSCYQKSDVISAVSGQRLLIIEDNIKYDETTSYYRNSSRKLLENFGTLTYTVNGKTITTNLVDRTPKVLKNVNIYQVSALIENADKVDLTIRNRNKFIKLRII